MPLLHAVDSFHNQSFDLDHPDWATAFDLEPDRTYKTWLRLLDRAVADHPTTCHFLALVMSVLVTVDMLGSCPVAIQLGCRRLAAKIKHTCSVPFITLINVPIDQHRALRARMEGCFLL